MLPGLKQTIVNHLKNIPGWHTNQKYVIFESDDWGSIRMPSRKTFEALHSKGLDLTSGDSQRYNLYDSLATPEDLSSLYEVLQSVKDCKGNAAVFTPICLVANPDFQKIKESGFTTYYYEPFTETLKRYPGCESSFDLWKQGYEYKLFMPEFHGREHLNVTAWMKALRDGDPETRLAFEHGCWGFRHKLSHKISYQAAFDLDDISELECQKSIIEEGLILFNELHGYQASYFVPPNGPFNNYLERIAAENGIKFMSAAKIQHEVLGNGKTRRIFHYPGQKNRYRQTYITRNCFFEPSRPGKNWVDSCLSEIEIAFRLFKPAVVSTHRVNYIGVHDPSNRENGLKQLRMLLKIIVNKWPDVTFLTSTELGIKMVGKM